LNKPSTLFYYHYFALKPGGLILFFIAKKSMQKTLDKKMLPPACHRTPAFLTGHRSAPTNKNQL
jgi:hypothetical protein